MCGILGFYNPKDSFDQQTAQSVAKSMGDAIRHRGPDDAGVWQEPEHGHLVLGHQRLSIIDLSKEGHQPKASHSGRYMMSYNGEIYNFRDLQAQLEGLGVQFSGRSDTEVMLAAFDQWGVNEALQKFVGMFAFAVWDKNEKALHLVRDRFGKKPLYIGAVDGALVFASELKAFHAYPAFKKEIDRESLSLFMQNGYVSAPNCIYKDVFQLLPGHRVIVRQGDDINLEDIQGGQEPFWSASRIMQDGVRAPMKNDSGEILDDLEDLLKVCVGERMIADVGLGAFLSGGIDSSLVVALMQKQATQPVKTFTVGFEEEGYNEAYYASEIAKALGTDHHELMVRADDALALVPQMPKIYDEPFADESQIPTCLISEFTRRHVTVALSGDGGDEMMGGYNRHRLLPAIWRKAGWLPSGLRGMLANLAQGISTERWDKVKREAPQFGDKIHKAASLLKVKDKQSSYSQLLGKWASGVVLDAGETTELAREKAFAADMSFSNQVMLADILGYLPDDILVKVDRASMAYGLECRAPLLDTRLYEYAARMPLDMKIKGGQGKWALRHILGRHVAADLFERPKQGFSVPVGAWLRGPLKSWAESLLARDRLDAQGLLDGAMIRSVWQDHIDGKGNHSARLWTVLMFQSWYDEYH